MRCFTLCLFLCLSLFAWFAGAQSTGDIHRISKKDSTPANTTNGWRFVDGDSPEYAYPSFNDNGRSLVNSLAIAPTPAGTNGMVSTLFKGIGWLRYHFCVDNSLAGKSLALRIWQNGASEVYLDGNLILQNGRVGNKDSVEYENPQGQPFMLVLPDTLPHVLALRYANWHYNSRNPVYANKRVGFRLTISDANATFSQYQEERDVISLTSTILFGIFSTLALLHLLFFLYYRVERSNLLFSLFCFSVALLFFSPYLRRIAIDPAFILGVDYYSYFLVILVCFTLCSFLTHLFSRIRKLTMWVNLSFFLLMSLLYVIHRDLVAIYYLIIVIATTAEAIFTLGFALIRKIPGARVIGGGLGLLLLFIVVVLVLLAINGGIYVGDGYAGMAIVAFLFLAILSIPISLSAFLARNFAITSRNLKQQLLQVEELSVQKQRLQQNRQEELEKEVSIATAEVRRQHEELKVEKKKTDDLLLNILPEEVAEELKQSGQSAARLYENVTVLFTDFVNFTQHSEKLSPAALVAEIHECFKAFDGIVGHYGLEKIKTVGDAYIAVSGLPVSNAHHARQVVSASIAIRDFMVQRKENMPDTFDIRLGIHSGPVVAGIVGVRKFAYDIWGDTVNTAARMEQASSAGRINISPATYELVKAEFNCSFRGDIEAKHKGKLGMYFVER